MKSQKKSNSLKDREKIIVKTSIVGIVTNVLLSIFKALIGIFSNSISLTLDAVNNLSDALSSIITIIGAKLSGKAPDKKHPLGYGRIEFLSSSIIALIVLYAGVTSLVESIKKIVRPDTPDYSAISLIIIAVGVIAKIVLGIYVKRKGESVNSDSLINSGEDARLDSIISASTLVAAFIFIFLHISLEAWLGAIISAIIIKSGIDMLRDSVSQILGERINPNLSSEIKETISEFPGIHGAYDLILSNYGPDRYYGSVHVAVNDDMSAGEIDRLSRKIYESVYKKSNVLLTGIGIYSINVTDEEARKIQDNINDVVMSFENVLQIHGLYILIDQKEIRFDIILDFAEKEPYKKCSDIKESLKKIYPDYNIEITLDTDVSD